MLKEIRIQNFAIIENLVVNFQSGLNVLTGETGAGKSIIIDALNLLLGGRADTDDEIAAVVAALAAHQYRQQAAYVVQRGKRDASNWKWVGRWERMHR